MWDGLDSEHKSVSKNVKTWNFLIYGSTTLIILIFIGITGLQAENRSGKKRISESTSRI